ncbi:MAG TPA: hypothetical protein PKA88_14880 [Polyangiaceae bacterium]|nr:hypothetical protein [Polyangiaceae bacterium]
MHCTRSLSALALALATGGCLPTDTRPPPGTLNVVARTEEATLAGVVTDDGWALSFEQLLVSVGHASAEGDDCTAYNDPDYARVLDGLRSGAQKINTLFVVGLCELDIELSSPKEDSPLGAGTTAADRDFLRTPGSDTYVPEGGVSYHLVGTATKGGVTKRFAWPYRNRIDYSTCAALENGVPSAGIRIREHETKSATVTLHGTAPFQTSRDAKSARLRFDAFAAADANTDGEVTLDELGDVLLSDLDDGTDYSDADAGWVTLEDYVYHGRFPKVVRYENDGVCELEIFPNDRAPR